jgi:L-amino acid N-acyltransferase YncA
MPKAMRGSTSTMTTHITLHDAIADDTPSILAIYNDAVAHTTATYDYEPRSLAEQEQIIASKLRDNFPVIVARCGTRVLGFATYGLHRSRPGWRFTCEHSVYVAADARGRGIGPILMQQLMARAAEQGFHSMVGVIDAANAASIRMHERCGFRTVGIMKEGGYKFDKWLDVAFMQAML